MADVTVPDLNVREMRAGVRAAVGHVDVVAPTDAREAHIVGRAAERLRENDWRKSLESIGQAEVADTHWGGWSDVVPGQVFTDVNPATGERIARAGTPEATRRRDIVRTMKAYDALLQNGYNSLAVGTPERTRIDDILTATIRGNPQLVELYTNGATPPVLNTAVVTSLMNEPALKKYLATALNEAYDPAKRFNMADVQKAVEAFTKANTELTNLTTERATNAASAAVTDAIWDATPLIPGGPTSRAQRMTDLRTDFASAVVPATLPAGHDGLTPAQLVVRRRDIANFSDNLRERDRLMSVDERRRDNVAIQALNERLTNARVDSVFGTRLGEYQSLVERRRENSIAQAVAARKVTELDGKIVDKTAEVNVARAAQADKLRDARAHSARFEQSINRALSKAVKNTIGEKVGVFLSEFKVAEKQSLDLAKEEHKQRISEELQRRLTKTSRRWINYLPGTGWLGNNKREVLNDRQIRRDARVLLREGPQALVDQVLRSARVPDGERALLLRDPAFMQQQGKEMYGKVLAGYIMSGGKIAPSQYEALSMTDWGPEVLTEMMAKSAEARAMVEQYTGQPYTEQSIRQLLADPNNQKWIRRALLAAGGIGLFYAGPAGVAAGAAAVGNALNYVAGDAAMQWVDAARSVGTAVAAGDPGVAVGKGVDAVVGAAGVVEKAVVDNVTAVSANSTVLQGAGSAISGALSSADAALRAGDVGTAVGQGAKFAADTVATTGDVIGKNVAAAQAAYTKP